MSRSRMATSQAQFPRAARVASEPLDRYLPPSHVDHRTIADAVASGSISVCGVVFDPVYQTRHSELRDLMAERSFDAILDPADTGAGVGRELQQAPVDTAVAVGPSASTGEFQRYGYPAHGSKSRFGCRVKECCPKNWKDMLDNLVRHSLVQRSLEAQRLSNVPEQHRAQRFLEETVRPVTVVRRAGAPSKADEREREVSGASSRRPGEICEGEPGGVVFADTLASCGAGLSGSSRVIDQNKGGRQ